MKKFNDYILLENKQLTKDITLDMLGCKDKNPRTPVPDNYISNAFWVAKNVQAIKDYVEKQEGRKFKLDIHSGYRTPAYNKKKDGARNSKHLTASAIDFTLVGLPIDKLLKYSQDAMRLGLIEHGGLARYKTFVHYDTRGYFTSWSTGYSSNFANIPSSNRNGNNLTQLKNKKEDIFKKDVDNKPSVSNNIPSKISIDFLSNINVGQYS
jgi:hypothetical protein